MKHTTNTTFWREYKRLPERIQDSADGQFKIMEDNPRHPSLQFKKVKRDLWSTRVTQNYRALAVPVDGGFQWFWIGQHDVYEQIIKRF